MVRIIALRDFAKLRQNAERLAIPCLEFL